MSNVNNSVTIFGNVANIKRSNYTRDDGSIMPIANYYLIINQGKNSRGEEITNAISASLYGNNAKVALNYIKVGDCLGVEGSLASALLEDEEGKTNLHVNVNANTIKIGKNLRAAINRVGLCGRLTKDPVVNNHKGYFVSNFSILVPRIVKKGEEEKSDLFNISVFGEKKAEFVQKYLGKGMLVYVSGKISSSYYESSIGKRKYDIKVIADSIDFAETKNALDHEKKRVESGKEKSKKYDNKNNEEKIKQKNNNVFEEHDKYDNKKDNNFEDNFMKNIDDLDEDSLDDFIENFADENFEFENIF